MAATPKSVPSNVRLASAFIASAPVAVKTLLSEPLVIKSDTSTEIASDATSIPVPAPTANDLSLANVPPPVKPSPAVNVLPSNAVALDAILELGAVKEPLIAVCKSESEKSTVSSLAATSMPVPPITFNTEFVAVIPAPASSVTKSAKASFFNVPVAPPSKNKT